MCIFKLIIIKAQVLTVSLTDCNLHRVWKVVCHSFSQLNCRLKQPAKFSDFQSKMIEMVTLIFENIDHINWWQNCKAKMNLAFHESSDRGPLPRPCLTKLQLCYADLKRHCEQKSIQKFRALTYLWPPYWLWPPNLWPPFTEPTHWLRPTDIQH